MCAHGVSAQHLHLAVAVVRVDMCLASRSHLEFRLQTQRGEALVSAKVVGWLGVMCMYSETWIQRTPYTTNPWI